jgi:geranylgeranyl diphosphate synthase type II
MPLNTTMSDDTLFTRPAALVEHRLHAMLDECDLPPDLLEASRHGVLGGGKRLRPALVVLSCESVEGETDHALPAAAALELVHCFSLVHDDLPALDNDELRRGQPTLHIRSGEAMAILAGDLMLTLAFRHLVEAGYDDGIARRLVSELATGTTGMVVGQVFDTLGGMPENLSPEDQLRLVHRNKTGALLRAACRMGAICGNADPTQLNALTSYGEAVGLMFQVVDDLLDVTQTAEHIGKATGKDELHGKLTYPGLLGVDASRKAVEDLQTQAMEALEPLGEAAGPLRDLGQYMAIRTK